MALLKLLQQKLKTCTDKFKNELVQIMAPTNGSFSFCTLKLFQKKVRLINFAV
jgi:hypothetical protein